MIKIFFYISDKKILKPKYIMEDLNIVNPTTEKIIIINMFVFSKFKFTTFFTVLFMNPPQKRMNLWGRIK